MSPKQTTEGLGMKRVVIHTLLPFYFVNDCLVFQEITQHVVWLPFLSWMTASTALNKSLFRHWYFSLKKPICNSFLDSSFYFMILCRRSIDICQKEWRDAARNCILWICHCFCFIASVCCDSGYNFQLNKLRIEWIIYEWSVRPKENEKSSSTKWSYTRKTVISSSFSTITILSVPRISYCSLWDDLIRLLFHKKRIRSLKTRLHYLHTSVRHVFHPEDEMKFVFLKDLWQKFLKIASHLTWGFHLQKCIESRTRGDERLEDEEEVADWNDLHLN